MMIRKTLAKILLLAMLATALSCSTQKQINEEETKEKIELSPKEKAQKEFDEKLTKGITNYYFNKENTPKQDTIINTTFAKKWIISKYGGKLILYDEDISYHSEKEIAENNSKITKEDAKNLPVFNEKLVRETIENVNLLGNKNETLEETLRRISDNKNVYEKNIKKYFELKLAMFPKQERGIGLKKIKGSAGIYIRQCKTAATRILNESIEKRDSLLLKKYPKNIEALISKTPFEKKDSLELEKYIEETNKAPIRYEYLLKYLENIIGSKGDISELKQNLYKTKNSSGKLLPFVIVDYSVSNDGNDTDLMYGMLKADSLVERLIYPRAKKYLKKGPIKIPSVNLIENTSFATINLNEKRNAGIFENIIIDETHRKMARTYMIIAEDSIVNKILKGFEFYSLGLEENLEEK